MTRPRLADTIGNKLVPAVGSAATVYIGLTTPRAVRAEIVKVTATQVEARYWPKPERCITERFWKKNGSRVGDRTTGFHGPYITLGETS